MTENESKYGNIAIIGGRGEGRTLKAHIDILQELEQYTAIGTVKEIKIREAQFARLSEGYLNDLTLLREYQAIGTVEELEAMKKGTLSAMELADMWCLLEDLKKYSAIGTIEEFKALKEKSVAKKVNVEQWIDTKCSCGYVFSKHHGDGYHSVPYENRTKYCPNCGKALDWSE